MSNQNCSHYFLLLFLHSTLYTNQKTSLFTLEENIMEVVRVEDPRSHPHTVHLPYTGSALAWHLMTKFAAERASHIMSWTRRLRPIPTYAFCGNRWAAEWMTFSATAHSFEGVKPVLCFMNAGRNRTSY